MPVGIVIGQFASDWQPLIAIPEARPPLLRVRDVLHRVKRADGYPRCNRRDEAGKEIAREAHIRIEEAEHLARCRIGSPVAGRAAPLVRLFAQRHAAEAAGDFPRAVR